MIKTNFTTFTRTDTDVTVRGGTTLRDRLLGLKRAANEEGEGRRVSAKTIDSLRIEFAPEDSPLAVLRVKNPEDPLDAAFAAAFEPVHHPNPVKRTKEHLETWMANTDHTLNQRELTGLLRTAASTNVHISDKNRLFVWNVATYIARHGLHITQKKDVDICRRVWDECFTQTYLHQKRNGWDTTVWFLGHEDTLAIIGDLADFHTLLAEENSWKNVEKQLDRVVAGSILGQHMFSHALTILSHKNFSAFCIKCIAETLKKPLTDASLKQLRDRNTNSYIKMIFEICPCELALGQENWELCNVDC